MKRLMIVAMVLGCLGAFAFGQTANAVLTGTTVDSSGALIPGVEVRATNVETGVTTTATAGRATTSGDTCTVVPPGGVLPPGGVSPPGGGGPLRQPLTVTTVFSVAPLTVALLTTAPCGRLTM